MNEKLHRCKGDGCASKFTSREGESIDDIMKHLGWKDWNGVLFCPKCAKQFFWEEKKADNVNHPPHYKSDTNLEAIDVIEAFNLSFSLGNAIKYILRAGKKDDIAQDLKKAKWYIDREINNIQKKCDYLE